MSENELDATFRAQDVNDPGGLVANKNKLTDTFYRQMYRLGRKLLLFAKVTGDQALITEVSFTDDTFLEGWFAIRKITGRPVYHKINPPAGMN